MFSLMSSSHRARLSDIPNSGIVLDVYDRYLGSSFHLEVREKVHDLKEGQVEFMETF